MFLCATAFAEEPWGKDADLAFRMVPQAVERCIETSPLVKMSEVMIGFHKQVISPADGPRSHFIPNSSQYTLDAIHTYGFFKGVVLGCDRLMRENNEPWVYPTTVNPRGRLMKYDPVK